MQLNDRAADDFEAYRAGLREDQIIYITPTPNMTVERILAIADGRGVVLQCDAPDTRSEYDRPFAHASE